MAYVEMGEIKSEKDLNRYIKKCLDAEFSEGILDLECYHYLPESFIWKWKDHLYFDTWSFWEEQTKLSEQFLRKLFDWMFSKEYCTKYMHHFTFKHLRSRNNLSKEFISEMEQIYLSRKDKEDEKQTEKAKKYLQKLEEQKRKLIEKIARDNERSSDQMKQQISNRQKQYEEYLKGKK